MMIFDEVAGGKMEGEELVDYLKLVKAAAKQVRQAEVRPVARCVL